MSRDRIGHVQDGWKLMLIAHTQPTPSTGTNRRSPRYVDTEEGSQFVKLPSRVAEKPTIYVTPAGVAKLAPGLELKENRNK